MGVILATLLLGLVTALGVILCALYMYFTTVFSYFQKRGIPFDPPTFPCGSYTPLARLQKSYSRVLADVYARHKRHKVVGLLSLWKKQILVNDPEIIKHVLVKDFDIFEDRGVYSNKEKDPLSAHLFALEGRPWKSLRIKLTPTFTSGKIKGMFPNIADCAKELISYVKPNSENGLVDCQTMFSRYGLAIIASTAFGLEIDALSNKDSVFLTMANKMFAPTWQRLFIIFFMFNGLIPKLLNMRVVPEVMSQFIMGVILDTVKFRETEKVVRNDYLQLLIELKNTGIHTEGSDASFSDTEVAAEAFGFILAGSETSSSAMSFCLYELALNPAVQERLLREVDELEDISYDSINSLEYLDMVVDETMRKHPPVGFLHRECSRDYRLPGTQTVIEKGTHVVVSVEGLHRDSELFAEPDRFIPERFSKENKNEIKPYTYLPFGEGPRFCIGKRFGKVTVKTGLAMLLRHYKVLPGSAEPVQLEVRTIVTQAAGGMWLRLEERDDNKPLHLTG